MRTVSSTAHSGLIACAQIEDVDVCVVLIGAFSLAIMAVPARLRGRVPKLWQIKACLWAGLAANTWCVIIGKAEAQLGLAVIASSVVMLGAVGGIVVTTPGHPAAGRASRRVLVVGAHPDDLELACGGTVAKQQSFTDLTG